VNSCAETLNRIESRAALEQAALAVHTNYGFGHRVVIGMVELLLGPLVRVFPTKVLSELSQVQKILVLEQGHLGDVVQLTPFLQNLRRRFPNAHITVLGRPGLKNLLEVQNLANELVPIQLPWAQFLPRWKAYNPFSLLVLRFFRDILRLRRREFDLGFVVNLGDYRANFALFLTGARRRVGSGFAGGGVFLTDVVAPDLSRMHRFEMSLRLLDQIGIPVIPSEKLLSLSPEDAEFGREFLARNGIDESDAVVGIHPGAGHAIKEWGEDRYRELADKIVSELGAKVIWFSDPGQPPAKLNVNDKDIVRAALPLRQFLAVLSCCNAFVGNDSGPMHMAAGLGVRVVAIFGPELPEWFGPLGAGHQIVVRKGMWCRPCWRKCRFAEQYCLRLISVEEVMQAVCNVVGRPPLAQEKNVAEVRL
jgi:ADP-heptose:LPS heptosyltransferase